MASRQLATLVLRDAERSELSSLARRRNTAQALALRARIVLSCAEGEENKAATSRRRSMPLWQELPLLLVVAFCLAVLIRTFLLQAANEKKN